VPRRRGWSSSLIKYTRLFSGHRPTFRNTCFRRRRRRLVFLGIFDNKLTRRDIFDVFLYRTRTHNARTRAFTDAKQEERMCVRPP